jgi:uncharacterized short protein YbdD (DUF466 family)
MSSDLLTFLGIDSKDSWIAWAKSNHPDKGGDTKRFQLVKEAVEARFGLGGQPASAPKHTSTSARGASMGTKEARPSEQEYSRVSEFLRKMEQDFINPPHRPQHCEAKTQSGKLCRKMRFGDTKYCELHGHIDPVGYEKARLAKIEADATAAIQRENRKHWLEDKKRKRQQDVEKRTAELRAARDEHGASEVSAVATAPVGGSTAS